MQHFNVIYEFHSGNNFGRDDERSSVSSKILTEVAKWMERFDCIVVGPGLGRDSFLLVSLLYLKNIKYITNTSVLLSVIGCFQRNNLETFTSV